MKFKLQMRRKFVPAGAILLVGLLNFVGFNARAQSPSPGTLTASERISRRLYFGQRLVQVGARQASEEESQLLLELLDAAEASLSLGGSPTAPTGWN